MKAKTMKITGIILTLVMLATILGMLAMTANATAAADITVEITGADGNPKSVTLKDGIALGKVCQIGYYLYQLSAQI